MAQETKIQWETDLEKAKMEAGKQDKLVFVDFAKLPG